MQYLINYYDQIHISYSYSFLKMDQKTRNQDFNNYVKDLFNNPNWKDRAIAVQNLGKLKEGRATNILARALKSEKDTVVINLTVLDIV